MTQALDIRESMVTNGSDPVASSGDVLCLFGGPSLLRDGRHHSIPEGAQRLLVLVALRGGRADRRYIAGCLWPDGTEDRAAGNLRSALWRLNRAGLRILTSDHRAVCLDPDVETDLHQVSAWADRVVRGHHQPDDLEVDGRQLNPDELLPGWYDDWVIFERERLRQRILHGLEAMSTHLRSAGRVAESVDAALQAVHLEPLRESAQRALISAHLAEGNHVEARRALASYGQLLHRELGLRVSSDLTDLVRVPRPRPPGDH